MNLDRIIAVRNDKTVYRDGERCIKVFRHRPASEVFHEARNQSALRQAGIAVPEVLAVTPVEGRWALLYRYVQGNTLSALLADESTRPAALEAFVQLQEQLYAQSVPVLNPVEQRLYRLIEQCAPAAPYRAPLYRLTETLPRDKGICHGDFVPDNVLKTPQGDLYILDCFRASVGSAALDAAATELALYPLDPALARAYRARISRGRPGWPGEIDRVRPLAALIRLETCGAAERAGLLAALAAVKER